MCPFIKSAKEKTIKNIRGEKTKKKDEETLALDISCLPARRKFLFGRSF